MTFDEIVEAFYMLEPDLDEQWRSPNKSISKIISSAVKFGVIERSKLYAGGALMRIILMLDY
jgi:hypothetical protein